MQVQELLEGAREGLNARHEYGEPYEHNGVTVIPASAVRGGGGGGSDASGGGAGGGFGVMARPTGAWVIKGDEVTWKPVVDPTKIVVGLELLAAAALLRRPRAHRARTLRALRRPVRKQHRPRLHVPFR